jgi:hypothetical protein
LIGGVENGDADEVEVDAKVAGDMVAIEAVERGDAAAMILLVDAQKSPPNVRNEHGVLVVSIKALWCGVCVVVAADEA